MQNISPKTALFIIIVILALGLVGVFVFKGSPDTASDREVPTSQLFDFYEQWTSAIREENTDPYTSGFHEDEMIAPSFSERLAAYANGSREEQDPVICRSVAPDQFSIRPVFADERSAEAYLVAEKDDAKWQAVISLEWIDDMWKISGVNCTPSEVDTRTGDVTFEREGFLIKNAPGLDPSKWHIVYEEAGVPGHTIPLNFSGESTCIRGDERKVCDPSAFNEADYVKVGGNIAGEASLDVVRLEFLPDAAE